MISKLSVVLFNIVKMYLCGNNRLIFGNYGELLMLIRFREFRNICHRKYNKKLYKYLIID